MTSYDEQQKILQLLKINSKGLTVGDIAKKIKLNRNSVAKYLDVLLIGGNVDMRQIGPAKLYFPSQRVPASKLLDYSSDEIIILDSQYIILQANKTILEHLKIEKNEFIGKSLFDTTLNALENKQFLQDLKSSIGDKEISGEYSYIKRKKRFFYKYKILKACFDTGTCGSTIMFENITSQKEHEKSLEMSIKLEETTTDIATDFIYLKKEEFQKQICKSLAKASTAISVDNTFIALFDSEFESFKISHTWNKDNSLEVPFITSKIYPVSMYSFWINSFKNFELYYMHQTKKSKGYEDKQNFLQTRGITSMITAPIILEGNLVGFIGFIMMSSSRFWDDSTSNYVRSLASIFSRILYKGGDIK